MFHLKYLIYFNLLYSIVAALQLNLYYIDWISEIRSESDNDWQDNCLRAGFINDLEKMPFEMISYCLSELPSTFKIENDDFVSKFTFTELSKQNISSQKLYLWSAPIDLIEHYQFYLNQLSTENDSSLGKEIFYNCTMPRFGPKCQYELHYHRPHHSSFNEIINDFYSWFGYRPTNLTCYTHLQCNRGPLSSCLDWSEICNGQIDCLDGGLDEEHCWQLEINQCKKNEYRCKNGQCIPQLFYQNGGVIPDCVDGSDQIARTANSLATCDIREKPLMKCEDRTCQREDLISSCMKKREEILKEAMYSSKDSSVPEDCWSAFQCFLNLLDFGYTPCNGICSQNKCLQIVNHTCPDMVYFPNVPILFGDLYFAFAKNNSQYWTSLYNLPFYLCYKKKSHYDDYFINVSKILFNNTKCILLDQVLSLVSSPNRLYTSYFSSIPLLHQGLTKYHLIFNYTSAFCNRSNMYQCIYSAKCISIHRLLDRINDCPYMDDENITAINNIALIEQLKQTHFKCRSSNKYISQFLVNDKECDCKSNKSGLCDDEYSEVLFLQTNILFQHICDGFTDLLPITIEERNETDETECEQWKCNNIYTRCNGVWNCPNGADESGCFSHPTFNCPSNYHSCVSPDTNQLICLSVDKANDGKVDCLGATDEPMLCGTKAQSNLFSTDFYCRNQSLQSCISYLYLCDGIKQCEYGDDEQFCTKNRTLPIHSSICVKNWYEISLVEHFLCNYQIRVQSGRLIYFELHDIITSVESPTNNMKNAVFSSSSNIQIFNQHQRQPRCHRGLDLRVWLNNNLTKNTCLCPPSFYGDQCQYQNQRISLTIQFRALSDSWQTPFAIVISLIDDSDERIIHSYEQIMYLSMRHCKTKFYIYLLYSSRPKNSTKQYALHIDFYEKLSFAYRGSLLLPVIFPFLPVHRLAFLVDIPSSDNKTQICFNDQCVHGKCIKYSNNPDNFTFCQCHQGWSGRYCTIQHTCNCASGSLCLGVSANNRSICLCPPNKFGPRCLLIDTVCQANDNSTCKNHGQCIFHNDYMVFEERFICLCRKGFSGNRCEKADNKLILSFAKDIVLSQQVFIHFIEIKFPIGSTKSTFRSTTFRTILLQQDSFMIHWSRPFHLVFIELEEKDFYLTVNQTIYKQSATINKTIHLSDRCPHIREVLNETIVRWPLIRRIKYYHLPCQNQSLNLSCFYDDVHLCLCYDFEQQRLANCFDFDHNMRFDCHGQSECENDAQCLQDDSECPTNSICICNPCFYGRRCQFSTNGFGLSLDAILGYHILPNVSLNNQPFIIKMSLSLTIIFVVAGLINGVLSIMTFKNKSVREFGCGLYLLGSSITTLFTMMMFGLKFLFLLLAQMTIISNRSFLSFQCHSIDFLLRICLHMDQWLNACVAMERAITTIKGTRFDKRKSKRAAKFVIIILLIINAATFIHDPIFRRLIDEESNNDSDDDNPKRTWCIATYSNSLQIYNYIIHILHFLGPFLINLISAIILITNQSRQQAKLHKQQSYRKIVREQFQQHRHLLTAPMVLVILALPRLIITFVSKCMRSSGDVWIFLVGYFISFIPPMLTFVVFVLTSKFYKKEFHKSVTQFRTNIQRRLHMIS